MIQYVITRISFRKLLVIYLASPIWVDCKVLVEHRSVAPGIILRQNATGAASYVPAKSNIRTRNNNRDRLSAARKLCTPRQLTSTIQTKRTKPYLAVTRLKTKAQLMLSANGRRRRRRANGYATLPPRPVAPLVASKAHVQK